jgi:hypothetical protein
MREIRSSGSVGEPVGDCRLYPEGYVAEIPVGPASVRERE